jgi:hypothetical protein
VAALVKGDRREARLRPGRLCPRDRARRVKRALGRGAEHKSLRSSPPQAMCDELAPKRLGDRDAAPAGVAFGLDRPRIGIPASLDADHAL